MRFIQAMQFSNENNVEEGDKMLGNIFYTTIFIQLLQFHAIKKQYAILICDNFKGLFYLLEVLAAKWDVKLMKKKKIKTGNADTYEKQLKYDIYWQYFKQKTNYEKKTSKKKIK